MSVYGYDLEDIIFRAQSDYAYVPPVETCFVWDDTTYRADPSWTEVGSGSNGTIVLSSAANAGDLTKFRALVVIVAHCENKGANNAGNCAFTSISDDATVNVKSYYKVNGVECYDLAWNMWSATHALAGSDSWGTYAGNSVQMWGGAAMKNILYDHPAGTTITYDIVNNHSVAKAYVVDYMAPYFIQHTQDGSKHISTTFWLGALAVVVTYSYDAQAADCSGNLGQIGGGGMTTAAGTVALSQSAQAYDTAWSGPPCVSSNVNITCETDVRLVSVPNGTDPYDMAVTPSPVLGSAASWGVAWPGQGTY